MQEQIHQLATQTILITTAILLLLGGFIVYFLFKYQRRRFEHLQQLNEVKDSFNRILLESKLEIQEQTLDHVAKELHANFSHLISLININLSTVNLGNETEAAEKISETKSLSKQLMSELKALSVSLNTDQISHLGFYKALENELRRLEKAGAFKVVFTKIGQEPRLSPDKEIILFRMCQEILNNIVKHAEACQVTVVIESDLASFSLSVKDDGKGFDTEFTPKSKADSTGLRNIRSRADLINSEVTFNSKPGEGTVVSVIMKL